MSTNAEIAELRRLSDHLRRCAAALAPMCADTPAMRRVINDTERIGNGIDRLEIDLHELELVCGLTERKWSGEMIKIPDTPYDADFWRDVDHEGIGGQNGIRGRVSHARRAG
jgi:hypothetical protein